MKRTSILLSLVIATSMFVSITRNNANAQTIKKATSPAKPTAKELEEGKILISKSDCLACHKLEDKLLGPSYKDVAKKYPATEANYNLLSQKVIKGGSGVWGNIPMAPHASLKAADAKKMVKYILSIK